MWIIIWWEFGAFLAYEHLARSTETALNHTTCRQGIGTERYQSCSRLHVDSVHREQWTPSKVNHRLVVWVDFVITLESHENSVFRRTHYSTSARLFLVLFLKGRSKTKSPVKRRAFLQIPWRQWYNFVSEGASCVMLFFGLPSHSFQIRASRRKKVNPFSFTAGTPPEVCKEAYGSTTSTTSQSTKSCITDPGSSQCTITHKPRPTAHHALRIRINGWALCLTHWSARPPRRSIMPYEVPGGVHISP